MRLRNLVIALGLLLAMFAVPAAQAQTHAKHSAAWYRTHRRKHSAAWYRSHRRKHSAAWYRKHGKKM